MLQRRDPTAPLGNGNRIHFREPVSQYPGAYIRRRRHHLLSLLVGNERGPYAFTIKLSEFIVVPVYDRGRTGVCRTVLVDV
jgi:hypothetical protein